MESFLFLRSFEGFAETVVSFLRLCFFCILSFGPIPTHVAFILDGNRRFARRRKLEAGAGHRAGYSTLMSTLRYCYEMGIRYVTVYAFSIDNFRRKADEVEILMNLMVENIESILKEETILVDYGIRINFWGDLKLLKDPVRRAAEEVMAATAKNTGSVLTICVAYTSTNEISHAVEGSCRERLDRVSAGGCSDDGDFGGDGGLSVADVERHLYSAGCPDPDVLIRTSGETRLSNFLLWQTDLCHLQAPSVLWPAFSVWHFVWAILGFQRAQPYLEKRRRFTLSNSYEEDKLHTL